MPMPILQPFASKIVRELPGDSESLSRKVIFPLISMSNKCNYKHNTQDYANSSRCYRSFKTKISKNYVDFFGTFLNLYEIHRENNFKVILKEEIICMEHTQHFKYKVNIFENISSRNILFFLTHVRR